jgi:hypothetical protein
MLLLIAFSSSAIIARGFTGRFSQKSVQIASYIGAKEVLGRTRPGNCFLAGRHHFQDYDAGQCLRQVEGKSNILLVGDSYSAMLWSALSTSLPKHNILEASVSMCPPLVHPSGSADCKRMMTYIFQSYLPAHPVQGLLLASRWEPKDLEELAYTIQWAKNHRIPVMLIGPEQEYDVSLPRLLAYSVNRNKPELPGQHRLSTDGNLDARLRTLALNVWHVPYISLYSATCDNRGCTEYSDQAREAPLMFDTGHLTGPGSLLIVHRLIDRGELRVLTDRR